MNQELEFNSMNQEDREVEIDLLDLFYYYRSKIILIIAAFVVGAVIAGCVTHFLIVPKYTATSTMYMVSSSSGSVVDLSDLNIGESLSQDYVELIKTRPILEETIDGVAYETFLYVYDGQLREMRCLRGSEQDPAFGEAIGPAQSLRFEKPGKGLLQLEYTREDGRTNTACVCLRSGG